MLNVDPSSMVARYQEPWPAGPGVLTPRRRCPIAQVGMIEAGLEEFIFHQHKHIPRHSVINRLETFLQTVFTGPEIILARVIGSIRQPQA